jgi:hypothetical protein
MKSKSAVFLIVGSLLLTPLASADVWKWVDAKGETHFVDTKKPIYTWLDSNGEVHFSDAPDHADAVSVEFVWHSEGSLEDLESGQAGSVGPVVANESDTERLERERAERYYCKRATEVYESYVNAPRLFRTNDAGEREYLNGAEAADRIAEARQRRDEICAGQ